MPIHSEIHLFRASALIPIADLVMVAIYSHYVFVFDGVKNLKFYAVEFPLIEDLNIFGILNIVVNVAI